MLDALTKTLPVEFDPTKTNIAGIDQNEVVAAQLQETLKKRSLLKQEL
jgi:hypothetical protein